MKLVKLLEILSETLNLSNNDFIRTTETRHAKSVQNLWNILEKKGEIYLSKYSGWYSVSDEAFYQKVKLKIWMVKKSITSGSWLSGWRKNLIFLDYQIGKIN